MWSAGFADYIIGYCPVSISLTEKAQITEFIIKAIGAARGPISGGSFDAAAAASFEGGSNVAEGAKAANRLNYREPASTKLMENFIVIINGGRL